MTAQNITFKDYAVGGTPVLVINGIGHFNIENRGQSPASVADTLQAPFATLADQIARTGHFSFESGVYYGITDSISRVARPAPTKAFQPHSPSDPGYVDPPFTGSPEPIFTITGVDGASDPGPDTYVALPVAFIFAAPAKVWALNANTVTVVTLRVWNWI